MHQNVSVMGYIKHEVLNQQHIVYTVPNDY